jgi:hypothetical protein
MNGAPRVTRNGGDHVRRHGNTPRRRKVRSCLRTVGRFARHGRRSAAGVNDGLIVCDESGAHHTRGGDL